MNCFIFSCIHNLIITNLKNPCDYIPFRDTVFAISLSVNIETRSERLYQRKCIVFVCIVVVDQGGEMKLDKL